MTIRALLYVILPASAALILIGRLIQIGEAHLLASAALVLFTGLTVIGTAFTAGRISRLIVQHGDTPNRSSRLEVAAAVLKDALLGMPLLVAAYALNSMVASNDSAIGLLLLCGGGIACIIIRVDETVIPRRG